MKAERREKASFEGTPPFNLQPSTSILAAMSDSYTVYFGGELFSAKHLLGNAALAEAVFALSGGRYVSILPQNLEQRDTTAHAIRDQDLRTLLGCDLGLFHYDGPELDSGTVVEYLFAKFADIPSVLLRTDFRTGGDQEDNAGAWNLMSSFFPRTRVVQLDSMALYQEALRRAGGGSAETPPERVLDEGRSLEGGRLLTERIAAQVITSLDALLALPPVLPRMFAESVYHWLALMPGLRGKVDENTLATLDLCARKQAKGLL